jgi:hypothetical protein
MKALLAATAALLIAGPALAQQATAPVQCEYQGALARPGDRYLSTRLTVPRDGRCTHVLGGTVSDLTIVTQPQHGRVENTATSVTYIPNPGFTGRDSYVFSARGNTVAQVTVSVDVR